MIFFKREKG